MGNRHSKWFPEEASRGWTRHHEERYAQLSARGSRPRSRKASRRCTFLETIEEEQLISDDHASAQNSQEELLPQDSETHPVAQMPPETVRALDVTQPAALMEARVKMKRIQEAKSDGQEQPYPVTAPFAEKLRLPNGSALEKQTSLTEERVSYCFYNTVESENPEEAKTLNGTVWSGDDLTPEDEAIIELEGRLFEYKGKATKEESLAPEEDGIDGVHCADAAVLSGDSKETDCPRETDEEYPLVLVSQKFLQSKTSAAEVKDRL